MEEGGVESGRRTKRGEILLQIGGQEAEDEENGGGRARHLSGKGKRHDGISEIALDIFACISLSVHYHLSPFS